MAEDVKFAFFATGKEGLFTRLAKTHVAMVRDRLVRGIRLDKDKQVKTSLITPPARVRFVFFSFQNQAVFVMDEFFGQNVKNQIHKFRAIEQVTDGISDFVLPYSQKLSIVDIYHAVRRAPRNSVIDLSIYSHGFVEGPVLMNTSDGYRNTPFPDGSPQRDPSDRDGRVRTDFFPNMGEDPTVAGKGKNALVEFHGGFAVGAAFRNFGCDVQDVVEYKGDRLYLYSLSGRVINQAFTAPRTIAGTIRNQLLKYQRPTQPITLHMGLEFDNEASTPDPGGHYSHETSDGQPLTPARLLEAHYDDRPLFKGETSRDVSREYAKIIAFVAQDVMNFYAFKAAQALPNITVFGALPATGGDFDKAGTAFPLMYVSNSVNRYYFPLRFYDKFVDIKSTEPGAVQQRHYGVFDAATVAKVIQHSNE